MNDKNNWIQKENFDSKKKKYFHKEFFECIFRNLTIDISMDAFEKLK